MSTTERSILPGVRSIAALRARHAAGDLTPHALVDRSPFRRGRSAPCVDPATDAWRDDGLRRRAGRARLRVIAAVRRAVRDQGQHRPRRHPDNGSLSGLRVHAGAQRAVVERLIAAGAIPIGKTNLDQFATGLSGQRSPYGACRNALDPRYASGGSSSGSAVAVALGVASFSLGTDTAGSGRVPAAFHGSSAKPTKGVLSTLGVVPACRSLDCVSVFAQSAADARCSPPRGVTDGDPYGRAWQPLLGTDGRAQPARPFEALRHAARRPATILRRRIVWRRVACRARTPARDRGDDRRDRFQRVPGCRAAALRRPVGRRTARRDRRVRRAGTGRTASGDPRNRRRCGALQRGRCVRRVRHARDAARRGRPRLGRTGRDRHADFGDDSDHRRTRSRPDRRQFAFGYYTNFVNLLDLSAIAVPAGRCETGRHAGLPFGITFVGRAHDDARLLDLAQAWIEADERGGAGEGGELQADVAGDACATATPAPGASSGVVRVAVVGAHLRGEPLNWQLTQRGGHFVAATTTAPAYRLYALSAAASGGVAAGPRACAGRRRVDRGRALGDAGRRLRQLRRRHCRPARHRHADARGRHSGAGLPV